MRRTVSKADAAPVVVPDGTELVQVDVAEVSLVDKPAIRRPFVVVKRRNGDRVQVDLRDGTVSTQEATKTEAGKTTDAIKVDGEVQKALTPVLEALVGDYLTVVQTHATAVRDGIQGGTLTKEDAYSRLWAIHDATYRVQDHVSFVAKSIGVQVELLKADRKMTYRRRSELKEVIDALQGLMSELEDDMGDTDKSEKAETVVTEKAAAKAEGEVKVETKAEPVVETKTEPVAKSDSDSVVERIVAKFESGLAGVIAKMVQKDDLNAAVTKAMEPIIKRIEVLEANPGTARQDSTDKVEVKKNDGKPASPWGGSILG